MRVCFFGSYVKDSNGIPSGNGGTLLKKILEVQNVQVIECHEDVDNFHSFIKAYVKLFFKHRKLDYDVMIIPWRGILTLPLAKLIHRRPIIYFPAFSIFDTLVHDRKKIKENSLRAKLVHMVDNVACKWVDRVILESTEEINYFVREFGLHKEKFLQLPLAADESIFSPQLNKEVSDKFTVFFFGTFIPLHGVETIVQSAIILQNHSDISFTICGDGQTRPEIEKIIQENNLKNMRLLGLVSKETLLENLKNSDVCLGIFGNTLKARKVVTNKVFQVLASSKPLITMDSPAARESKLESGTNCILVPPSSPEKLADAILFMKDNREKREQMAIAGYQTYVNHLSMNIVGKQLVKFIQELLAR